MLALQVSKLHSLLRPFLLRRIKSDVESSLPAKAEVVLYAHMAPDQKRLNEQLCDRSVNVRPSACFSLSQSAVARMRHSPRTAWFSLSRSASQHAATLQLAGNTLHSAAAELLVESSMWFVSSFRLHWVLWRCARAMARSCVVCNLHAGSSELVGWP